MRIFALSVCLALALTSCEFASVSPHERYRQNLVSEGLDRDAQLWETSAAFALVNPLAITVPYFERRILHDKIAFHASAFSVQLATDQQLQVDIKPSDYTEAPVFVDIFQLPVKRGLPDLRESKNTDAQSLTFQAARSGTYIVRIQAGYKSRGLIDVSISSPPTFPFPVEGKESSSVLSFFGDARDRGRRSHKGIDIFGARGTPILSVSNGRVSRIGDTGIGGKHVWVKDGKYSFYYAHLDSITIARGDRVSPGVQLGTMGNTGNAKTTSPHLHFGVYKRFSGAVNPFPLVDNSGIKFSKKIATTPISPRWVSISTKTLNVRASPSTKAPVVEQLKRGDLVQVFAGAVDWLRVETSSGSHGFVARKFTEKLNRQTWTADADYLIQSEPYANAPVFLTLSQGQTLESLGEYGQYRLVSLDNGLRAWARARQNKDTATPNL